MKAYFLQRLGAYVIDILLVSVVISLITMWIPANENVEKYTEEQVNLSEQYLAQEVDTQDYLEQTMELDYKIQRYQIPYSLIELCGMILYFVVFQFYNKGRTLGKKLMKIRVTRNDGKALSINDLALRSLLSLSLFANILILLFSIFGSAPVYFIATTIIELIQMGLLFATVIMMLVRKDGRGLHDLLGGTQVVAE